MVVEGTAVAIRAHDDLLLQLPQELWVEVLRYAGPQALWPLRESCRAMRAHLGEAPAFWQCMCKQSFAPWTHWMASIGWDIGAAASGPAASAASRTVWQARFTLCCRDQQLLLTAGRLIERSRAAIPPSTANVQASRLKQQGAVSGTGTALAAVPSAGPTELEVPSPSPPSPVAEDVSAWLSGGGDGGRVSDGNARQSSLLISALAAHMDDRKHGWGAC